jgi:hypothetical protein
MMTTKTRSWDELIFHPMAIAISGARGSGKSGLAYWLAETMGNKRECKRAVLGLSPEKEVLLPEGWEIIDDITHAPPNSVVLVDEVALQFHARRSQSAENLAMDRVLSISRQAAQDVIFATHSFRKMDVAIVSDLDIVACKKPSFLHKRFERSEIRQFTQTAAGYFEGLEGDHRLWTYVFTDDYEGPVTNPLPEFWTDDLSRGWATTNPYQRAFIAVGILLSLEELRFFETHPYFAIHREFIDSGQPFSKYQAKKAKEDLDLKRGVS